MCALRASDFCLRKWMARVVQGSEVGKAKTGMSLIPPSINIQDLQPPQTWKRRKIDTPQ